LAIVNLAKEQNQTIAVQVERLNHVIFLYVDDNLPADKYHYNRCFAGEVLLRSKELDFFA